MGEYEKALPLLIQGSEAGFIPVNVMIGDCYWNGYGVTVDTTTAIQYYLLAAELGDAGGLMRMGHVYLQCNEPEKAVECYTKAYDKGIDDALFNLAVIYYTGYEAIERNYKEAACLLEKYIEIEPNSADALHLLGRCYLFMENRDLSKAESLFVKAAALGNQNAARDRDALQFGGNIIEY